MEALTFHGREPLHAVLFPGLQHGALHEQLRTAPFGAQPVHQLRGTEQGLTSSPWLPRAPDSLFEAVQASGGMEGPLQLFQEPQSLATWVRVLCPLTRAPWDGGTLSTRPV